jgi:hypothetical protein
MKAVLTTYCHRHRVTAEDKEKEMLKLPPERRGF